MFLDHRVVTKIARILSRMSMNIMLLDNGGHVILPEDNPRDFTLPEALRQNPTQPFVYGGFTLIGTEGAQPLFLCLPGDSQDIANCAILSAELVNMLTRVDLPNANREQSLRCILRDEVEGAELETLALMHNIPLDREQLVILLHLSEIDVEPALSILKNIVAEDTGDAIVEMDQHTIVIIKGVSEQSEYEEMEQLGLAIENTFMSEASHPVYIGIGEPCIALNQLSESFREARRAIDVGRVYRSDEYVFVYRKLLLERFLAETSQDMCLRYNQLMFNRKTARLFNEEMIHTIEKFFENNLNLSETARQIYIHRNTLVYRLDKVQRVIGLDLRAFDDAVTFKMMMLLGKTGTDRNRGR